MDDGGHRENGRHKVDPYKSTQGQWMMQHSPSMKQVMAMMAERDAAIQERNLALAEKKAALAERDMAYLQRDAAIAERNNALLERDNAVSALQYRDSSLNNNGNISSCPPGCQISRGVKHMHQAQPHVHHMQHMNMNMNDASYAGESVPMSPNTTDATKSRRGKRAKEPKPGSPNKRASKPGGKVKRESEDLNKMGFEQAHELSGSQSSDWKGQDLGLNHVAYDESTMPAPMCSCTGIMRQCYKWGNGGWQSSCCTTTMSMYPLPAVPNKRHARVGGRKMSGSAFNKLLSRIAAEGHDLSNPVDLKDNWAKHGTNRYITIK